MISTINALRYGVTTPVLAAALTAIVFLLLSRPKSTATLRAMSLFFLFCLAWRLRFPLVSRRYVSVLIFPGVVLGCYAFLFARDQLRKWHFFDHKVILKIFYALLFVIPVIFIWKSWHFNPYVNSLKEICAIARDDAAHNPHASTFLDFAKNSARISFFSKLPADCWQHEIIDKNPPDKQVAAFFQALHHMIGSNSTIYVFAKKTQGKSDAFQKMAADTRWELKQLAERYINRRRKQKWVLYRFSQKIKISSRNIQTPQNAPDSYHKNVLMNGDFEKTETLEKQNKACARYVANKSMFFADQKRLIPWRIGISDQPGGLLGADAEIEACSVNPLAGVFSLRLKSSSMISVCIIQDIPRKGYRLSFWLKSKCPSLLNLYVIPFTPWAGNRFKIATISVLPGTVREYVLDIPFDLVKNYDHFRLVFVLDFGEVLIDNTELHGISTDTAFSRN